MATKQDLINKQNEVLAAIQALSAKFDATPPGEFDTAPMIVVMDQMLVLLAAMSAKLNGVPGVPGVPVITAPTLAATAQINVPFTLQVQASGSPVSFAAVGLPANLSINASTGLISGTALALGVSTVSLTATNSLGVGTSTLTLTVQAEPVPSTGAPAITSTGTAVGQVGTLFTHQITASNSPTSYNVVGLPQGVSFNPGTGVIFGTPLVAGTTAVTVSATNASGTGNAQLLLTVNP